MIIKRSECGCICHTDAVALGMIAGPMHVIPCCEPDDNLKADGGYCVRCDTVWASPGKCRCEVSPKNEDIFIYNEKSSIHLASWNAAIEAAAKLMNEMGEEARITHYVRKLKK